MARLPMGDAGMEQACQAAVGMMGAPVAELHHLGPRRTSFSNRLEGMVASRVP